MSPSRFVWIFLLPLAVGCASGPPPWNVPKGEERRFRTTLATCHKLTDASDGRVDPEAFEGCMNRRGFRRERFYEGWFRFDHQLGGSLPS